MTEGVFEGTSHSLRIRSVVEGAKELFVFVFLSICGFRFSTKSGHSTPLIFFGKICEWRELINII